MPLVQCKQCLMMADVGEGEDPHLVMRCRCCTEDHHHGAQANACPQEHDGPCWQGPESGDRPEGCTVCRPLIFMGNVPLRLSMSRPG